MKRFAAILAFVCAAMLTMGALPVYAYSDDFFTELEIRPADGFYTVITDTDGDEHTYDGVINAQTIESSGVAEIIASYAIYYDNEAVFSVALNDIVSENRVSFFSADSTSPVNGYYSVKFTLSAEDNTEAFLTGLSDSNLDMVQEQLISAKLENSEFTMESLDFIDAEKTSMPDDGDNELCWAAAASNILHYTGWGEQAGYSSPDALFDLFRDSFDDAAGNTMFGYEWFFNGTCMTQTWDGWAQARDYGTSGGYLKQYSVWNLMGYFDVSGNHEFMNDAAAALEAGCGMGISLAWLDNNGSRKGGHAISMWGYICDKDFAETDADYYKALIISDSDSDQPNDTDRRTAPNKLRVLNMTPYAQNIYDSWSFDGYGGVLETFIVLAPYSDDVEYETDESATLDKFSDPDITAIFLCASNDATDTNSDMSTFSTEDSIYMTPVFENDAVVDFDGTVDYTVTVTDQSDNSEMFKQTYSYTGEINAYSASDISKTEAAVIEGLPAGDYTAAVTVNPEKTVTEAYYYNNTYTFDFTVSDTHYDLSQVSFHASVGPFSGGMADARFTYDGFDSLDLLEGENVSINLYASYYEDGAWSAWEIADTSDELPVGKATLASEVLPEKCRVYAWGEKVKFRLSIKADNESIPVINIYSNEQELQYTKLSVIDDAANTGVYSPLAHGANELAAGELIAFKVKNLSTYDSGNTVCSAAVYARNSEECIELFRQNNISLAYGEATETISFRSWNAETDLSGQYEIVAVTESDYGSDEHILGTLAVEEKPSFAVTTDGDTLNPYDGVVSLREAVSYIKQYGTASDKITFDESVFILYLDNPITVDANIKITGNDTIIYGDGKTQLFYVTESGTLEGENLRLHSGYSQEYGGAVENRGGTLCLQNSVVLYSNSKTAGGGIYSDGGHVTLKNCSLKGNTSSSGGAVEIGGGAVLDMLGCTVFQNISGSGAIYNGGGTATIIYSSFTDNAASSSGGAITSVGTTNVFGSITVQNGDKDIDGSVCVYGSYYTKIADGVSNEASVQGDGNRIFACDTDGKVIWTWSDNPTIAAYKADVSSVVNNGIYVENRDGKIAFSTDHSEWFVTDAASAFTNEEYGLDIFGKEHGRLFGSISETCENAKIIGVTENTAVIYVPAASETVLIEKNETSEHVLTGVNVYEKSLDIGTNIIDLNTAPAESGITTTYMLWDNFVNVRPLCKTFTR